MPHLDILRLAAAIDCDPRTARRLLDEGPTAVRSHRIRERARTAAAELGIALGEKSPTSTPPPASAA